MAPLSPNTPENSGASSEEDSPREDSLIISVESTETGKVVRITTRWYLGLAFLIASCIALVTALQFGLLDLFAKLGLMASTR